MPFPQPLTDAAAELIAHRFRLLAEPMRVRILDRLRTGEANVHELAVALGTTPQNVSKHLGVLAAEGVVARRKVGNFALYRVVDEGIWSLCHLVCGGIERRLDELRMSSPSEAGSTGASPSRGREVGRRRRFEEPVGGRVRSLHQPDMSSP